MLTQNERKQILDSLLGTVSGISDKSYQYRVWIEGLGPEVDDFDETVMHFFQDGDGILDKYKEFGLTHTQYQALKDFRGNFKVFANNNFWPPEFIESREWTKITEQAKEVLKLFDYQPTIYIKLNKTEFDYLKTAPFVLNPLFLSDYTGEYILITDAEEIEKIKNLCRQRLKLIQSNRQVDISSENEALKSVIAALKRKEQPSFELNQR